MHNTMKKTITVCSLLTLLSVCQWGWAELPHFNLIGSFAEGDQWNKANTTKPLNKSYHGETSKYYIDVDVEKDTTYFFAFNNHLNNDGADRYAPLTENTDTQNKDLDLSALLNYEPVEAAKGGAHQSGDAWYNDEHGGQNVSDHSWKITANYTGKLRICVDQSGPAQHYYPRVWLERPAYYLIGNVINGDSTWSANNRKRPLRDKIGESTYYRYFYMPQNAYFAFTYREKRYAPSSDSVVFSTLPQTLSGERKDEYNDNSWKYTGSGCSACVKVDVSTSDVEPVITVEERWPDTVYAVGSGCWVGWSTDGWKAMTETAPNSGIYKDTLKLIGGTNTELKFLCVKGEYSTMFGKKAGTGNISGCDTYQVQMENGRTDSKWQVNLSENTYFVVLDAPQSQLRIHPYLPSANLSLNPNKTALTLGESVHFAPAMSGYSGTYTYLVNDKPVELEAGQWQPSKAGTYEVKVQINAEEQCVTSAPSTITVSGKNVTVRLHATEEAKAKFDNTFYLYYWGDHTGAQMAEFSEESDGWREATVHIDENLKFLVKNVNDTTAWGDGVKQTTNVDNAGKGYTANVCAEILSRGAKEGQEYFKYKLYELSKCTYSTNNFTIHAYVDDALKTDDQTYKKDDTQIPNRWDVVSFYTYGNAHMQYNDFWINDISSGEDGWYSHTYRNVDSVNLVIAGSTASWTGNPHRQAQDIKKITTDKYFFVTNSPKNTQNNRRVAIELPDKKTPITLTFRFTDVARQTWGGLDVYLRYWMYYQEPGDSAYDHAFYKKLVADGDGIYSCTILPIAPVKLTIQSGGSEYHNNHTSGHWTNDLVDGYTTNMDFIIKDYNDGGHVLEEYTEEQMKVHMTPDGFASACWDKNWTTDQAGVYIGTYISEEGLELKPVSDPIVPANEGVFLYNPDKGNQYITLLKTDNTPTADYSGNALKGTTSLTNRDTEKTTYVLGYSTEQSQAMLFRYTADQIPSNKAYLEIPVIASAPQMRMFIRNKTTDVNTTKADRMVVKKMESGRIVIVVNGLKYNIVGQKIE